MADKIRDFFRRKKTDSKFKQAGPGHKLTEARTEKKQKNVASSRSGHPVQPTNEAKRAAEAALARVEAQKQQNKIPNWSLSAVRAQAQKEMEMEAQADQKSHPGLKIVCQESAPVLSVSGVYYNCPLVGPDVLPKNEMQEKIQEFLYSQLDDEPGLTACLIIRTCNNKEKVTQGVETLCKYLNNIIDNPEDEKYQKIRLQNKVFQEKVSNLQGAMEFLTAAGFEQSQDGQFLVFSQDMLSDGLDSVQTLVDALVSSEPILPELDRNTRVLLPREAHAQVQLPDEFFNMTSEEVRREQERRTEDVELNSVLRTKAMRERDALKEARFYRFTLIRVKFPDGIILQGTFSVREKLSSVLDFIHENLAEPLRPFQLLSGGHKLDSEGTSLLELKLVPAVLLHLSWTSASGEFSRSNEESFLKQETMALLQSL